MKIFSRNNGKSYECKKELLRRIIAINIIITSLFCYIPINSDGSYCSICSKFNYIKICEY